MTEIDGFEIRREATRKAIESARAEIAEELKTMELVTDLLRSQCK